MIGKQTEVTPGSLPFSPHQLVGFKHKQHPVYYRCKRCFDIVFASVMLILLTPLFLTVAFFIWLEDGGPILYSQKRVGQGGKVFRFFKFRSMYRDADARRAALVKEQSDSVRFKAKNDPRITRIGRLIRRGSIDELPQFWNVLIGDMTVVGPRPALPEEVAFYTPHQLQRLKVAQGLTCIWQVNGRSLIPFEQQVEMDIEYINKQSVWLDMKLIFLTVPAVLSRRGAY